MGTMFHCDVQDPCHAITVVNNTIAQAAATGRNPWSCQYIASYTVAGNVPEGLEECMAQSMTNHSGSAMAKANAAATAPVEAAR